MTRTVPVFMFVVALVVGLSQVAFAQTPSQIVEDRQDAMDKMWPDFYREIARTVRSGTPDLALVATKATQAEEHVKKVEQLFPPGTGRDVVPATRAKPEVWTERADFDAAFKALADATKTIGEDAKNSDADKVKADWTSLAKACGACHGGAEESGGKFRFAKQK